MIADLEPVRVLAAARSRGATWGGQVVVLDTTTSTQDEARRAGDAGAVAGTTVVADVQERGRGRQGRVWCAPAGSALLASVVLRPTVDAALLPPLALVVGLAVARAIERRVPPMTEIASLSHRGSAEGESSTATHAGSSPEQRVKIKWPNDVLIDGRKVAGVLVEATVRGTRAEMVIAGFGVNIRRAALPPDLVDKAITLEEARAKSQGAKSQGPKSQGPKFQGGKSQGGKSQGPKSREDQPLDRSTLLAEILADLETLLRTYEQQGLAPLLPELDRLDATRGRHVQGAEVSGIAIGIAPDGRLQVRTATTTIQVGAGEVTFTDW
jgi:BirA family biotin operon repressor/biotin-[acetyl-CoA-carboxylase] ligase